MCYFSYYQHIPQKYQKTLSFTFFPALSLSLNYNPLVATENVNTYHPINVYCFKIRVRKFLKQENVIQTETKVQPTICSHIFDV